MLRWPENAAEMGNVQASTWKRGITIAHAVVELRDVFPVSASANVFA
jgi:hypothetical protein